MIKILPFQPLLRQRLPEVLGNADYTDFRQTLQRINEIITAGDIDAIVIVHCLETADAEARERAQRNGKSCRSMSWAQQQHVHRMARQALRCAVARHLLDEAYRPFSCRLADSPLLQEFCLISALGPIRVPSKSTLERYEKMVPEELIRQMVLQLTHQAGTPVGADGKQIFGLAESIDMEVYFLDTTCLQANIHFPVDWVLLRDATVTLMKAVKLIRNRGLKHRMQEPGEFIKEINRLTIQMSQARNRKGSKKERKKILRLMKRVLKKIRGHAQRHRELMVDRRQETGLTEKQAAQIVKRLDGVLEKLPEAIRQAHERIIGERLVKNEQKILSLYEEDLHVMVRGKAGARVEFGNTLLIGEQRQGLIVDWKLYRDQVPSDQKILRESVERMEKGLEGYLPKWVVSDRGFFSVSNKRYLEGRGIRDGMCPKSVQELRRRMEDGEFREHQRRRGQTEGRIGIVKNEFLGRPLRSKGFESREMSVGWAVLAHNLWVIARLPEAEVEEQQEAG